jgi:hypothetical protein
MVGEDPPISRVLWWVSAALDRTLRLSGQPLTLIPGPLMTEKRIEKWRSFRHLRDGSAYFNASDRLHFFQAGASGRYTVRGVAMGKKPAKNDKKTPSVGKSVCISVPIPRCFASGQTLALVATGQPIGYSHPKTPLLALARPKCVA